MTQQQTTWTSEEINILHSNYGKITYKQIQQLIPNRTVYQIRNKANYDGLCSKQNLRKYSVNKSYFTIPNEENCYWAGFIAADGCVSDNNALSIKLQTRDKELLEVFTKNIQYTNNVKNYKTSVGLQINCEEICKDLLINFNITPRKSKTLQPPNITEENSIACFIKGVIDGDGSIGHNELVIYGSKNLLEWIKSYFDTWIPKTNYPISEVRQIQSYLYAYKIGSKRKEYIINKFKQLKCYELKRKWNK